MLRPSYGQCSALALAILFATGCSQPAGPGTQQARSSSPAPDRVIISIVGTNDLHGALDRLPILAGFINNLRAARSRDGGDVLLIDAGDMFQGTIESNSNEGAAVIEAYNAMGYAAATVGNHEFDFGPTGPSPVPTKPGDDPRGALKERMQQARFPILSANVQDAVTGARVSWPGSPASVIRRVAGPAAGPDVGIIGLATAETLSTTMAANVVGLDIAPLADTVLREAKALRQRGAAIVIVTAHAGGKCKDLGNPDDLTSCADDEEIMALARALPAGTIDVIVAGHTHQAVAHRVNGIAIIESYARGRAFGRVDIEWSRSAGKIADARIFAPRDLCAGNKRAPAAQCQPGDYEGSPVAPDPSIAAIVAPALKRADEVRKAPLGVEVSDPLTKAYDLESPLGNLFADLMLAAMPVDIALTNGGGVRADVPSGPLTYGDLYEAMPFDNRFATIKMSGAQFAQLLAGNLGQKNGIFLIAGARATARCNGAELEITLTRDNGRSIGPNETITVVTSDFLASVSGGLVSKLGLPDGAIEIHDGTTIRDAMAKVLRERGGTLSGTNLQLFDPNQPRIQYPQPRPVKCSANSR